MMMMNLKVKMMIDNEESDNDGEHLEEGDILDSKSPMQVESADDETEYVYWDGFV